MVDVKTPGPGVDSTGIPVLDPTANVLALVAAAIKRQDDLRDQEARHVREMLSLRSQYEEKLRDKESARLDAIRTIDVGEARAKNSNVGLWVGVIIASFVGLMTLLISAAALVISIVKVV